METVGRFEFNRKDLIGHGAFAVVFKGRCTEKHDCEVAIKCINKKNLIKSQTLLGKEIKILKELEHDNIVALYDFQEMANSVYLVMEYCNGGDLADYLLLKGSLSEDTIRLFLQQMVGAMRVLHDKGVIHRDLKPQNILLSHVGGRKANPSNIRIKIADFGFARYLQSNTLAATLCGSPMYMAPEVIMSQSYDAKVDLWSIGTIVFQCLTGKAPFQANSPQNLRLFYEKNKSLVPNLPRETSTHLRRLLLGLLVRNHKERMDFGEFFHHPFLDGSTSMKKSAAVAMPMVSGSVSNSSCSSSSTSHLASPPSLCEVQPPRGRSSASVVTEDSGFLQVSRDSAASSKNSSCDTDDFVLVPYSSPGELLLSDGVLGGMLPHSLSSSSRPGGEEPGGTLPGGTLPGGTLPGGTLPGATLPGDTLQAVYAATIPIPVPTQVHNYQRMEQNLQSPPRRGATPSAGALRRACSSNVGGSREATMTSPSPRHRDHGSSRHRRSVSDSSKPCSPPPQGVVMPGPCWHGQRGRLHSAPSLLEPPTGQQQRSRLHSAPSLLEPPDGQQQRGRLHSAPSLLEPPAGQQQQRGPCWDPALGFAGPHQQPHRHTGLAPKLCQLTHRSPLPTIVGSPTKVSPRVQCAETGGGQSLLALLAHQGLALAGSPNPTVPKMATLHRQLNHSHGHGDTETRAFGRSLSAARMSDMLLRVAFGGPVTQTVGGDSPSTRPTVDTTVGPLGSFSSVGSCGPDVDPLVDVYGGSPGPQYSFPETLCANMEATVTFEAPELPEDTLMEQEHVDTLRDLRFTLAFAHCVLEIGSGPPAPPCPAATPATTQQPSADVVDRISALRREWSFAEQLVLSMKVAELLSTALHLSKTQITQGRLYPSSTVKHVVRKLNQHYRSCVSLCRTFTLRLQRFFVDKQELTDRINSITAEKLIYSHTVHMVQAAALDEMFGHGRDCSRRYRTALLLMEGLAQMLTDRRDLTTINTCKLSIERRLWALHPELYVGEPLPGGQW